MKKVRDARSNSIERLEWAHKCAGRIDFDLYSASACSADRRRKSYRAGLETRQALGPIGYHLQFANPLRNSRQWKIRNHCGRNRPCAGQNVTPPHRTLPGNALRNPNGADLPRPEGPKHTLLLLPRKPISAILEFVCKPNPTGPPTSCRARGFGCRSTPPRLARTRAGPAASMAGNSLHAAPFAQECFFPRVPGPMLV